ncbi:unnamed protein product (macronuclear) [Paramecium tetraurelia]|uniref:Histidine kinase n=1 Tax=Paramecium tetraurelia TaxID=5888 RepID=A0DQ23_PARTE|nr:uncharacterized protein GSPATT00002540001 [Paramecium tetraurelia]CAK85140.1 unnamed protein product [Paramecium tetraurelia]|eukprot:XP_001452537.1 hypothetical protein (macronuclear) [Paramecium tetraurelia strain d4-2]
MSIIIMTLIIQSTIVSIYNGVTQTEQSYFLLLDILLFLGQYGQNLKLILLIGSICLSNELLIADEDVNFILMQIKCYYMSMRFVLSANVLLEKQKSIYFLSCLFYLLFRSLLYLQPLSYLTIFGYLMILIQCKVLNNAKVFLKIQVMENLRITRHNKFLSFSKQVSLFLFVQFKIINFYLKLIKITPQIIRLISSEKNKDSITNYISNKRANTNKSFTYEARKRLNNCNVLQNDSQAEFYCNVKNYFPVDIEVAEIIWEEQPATMLVFQTQEQRQDKNQINDLKQKDQYKDEMLASVSHDFKTPINGIVAIVQFLESIVVDQNELNYLKILKKWAQLLLFMISDILDFSRIQNNTLRLTNTTFYIQVIVQEIIDLISLQANQKGIIVEKKITFGDRMMYSDPNRIKQILLNLLSNSLKFTEKGKINILVDYKYTESDSQYKIITISVSDTGVGIPDNIKPKLFQMYGTFDFTNNGSNKHGIGLGLVICKKLVGLLGPSDKIELKSQVGIGSTFSFDVYIDIDQRNTISKQYQKEMTNIYKQDTKQSLCDHQNTNLLITSQFTIFNQTIHQPTINNNLSGMAKKLNKKSISTLQEINDKKSHKAQQFRTLNPKKPKKKSLLQRENSINNVSLILEDSDYSKTRNIEYYLEFHNDITYATQLFKNQRQIEMNNSPINTPFYQNESSESPAMHIRQRKPLQFTESIEDMMRILFPEPCTILVVDDSPVNVFAFRLIMQKYDFITIEEAYNGEQALQKIRMNIQNDRKYQFIFMDLTMPIMNGYEATEQIRIMKDNLIEKSFIIALTGYDDLKEKEKCQQKGFDAFVSKPIKIIDIISVVNEVKNIKDPQI